MSSSGAVLPSFDLSAFIEDVLPLLRCPNEAAAVINAAMLGQNLCVALRALLASSQRNHLLQALAAALDAAATSRGLSPEAAAAGPVVTSLSRACEKQNSALLSSISSLLLRIQASCSSLAQYSEQNSTMAAELDGTGLVVELVAQKKTIANYQSDLCSRMRLMLRLASSPGVSEELAGLVEQALAAPSATAAAPSAINGSDSTELPLYQQSPETPHPPRAGGSKKRSAAPTTGAAGGKRVRNTAATPARSGDEGAGSAGSSSKSSSGGGASSQTESFRELENLKPLTMFSPLDNMNATAAASPTPERLSGSQKSVCLSSQEIPTA